MEASPINPSDLGLLIPGADMTTATVAGTPERPIVTASLGAGALAGLSARIDKPLPVGNEGAGTVVAAGQSLGGAGPAGENGGNRGRRDVRAVPSGRRRRVSGLARGRDGEGRGVVVRQSFDGSRNAGNHAPRRSFGLVHTAAASNLGQMLVKLCIADGVPLVNIVRKPDQEELLRSLGAVHVCNTASPTFTTDLVEALKATSATLAFDATGGGTLASQILNGMEEAANSTATEYSRYGSTVHKQVYIYGGLDTGPTVLTRNFGMAWGLGGWLLTPFLQNAGAETIGRLRARVAAELTTTFASTYTREVSLAGMLRPDAFNSYVKRATGEKFLVTPQALP